MTDLSIKANFGIVLRGDVLDIKFIVQDLEPLLLKYPGIKVIHKQISVNKLWIQIGDEMNEYGFDFY